MRLTALELHCYLLAGVTMLQAAFGRGVLKVPMIRLSVPQTVLAPHHPQERVRVRFHYKGGESHLCKGVLYQQIRHISFRVSGTSFFQRETNDLGEGSINEAIILCENAHACQRVDSKQIFRV